MRLSRHSRYVTALIALFSVLFMQLAVAAYACPTVKNSAEIASNAGWASASAHSDMDGCEAGMDTELPALCFAYSQEGNQSLYKPPVPDIQPAVVVEIIRATVATVLDFRTDVTPAPAHWLTRASDPPLSIRNCCFRI
ncbi:hypothetical protein [Noviherbaspirillum denitrificans]|uniref:Rap1a immunity protein domain-containing protein n=1 Tax=Noviherbaspirillum denitrificans TaxID=1968433 RepID=A0A254TBB5_9BURK|nr:hypothetical protein [Noviherbaspirillum denitrificans]OWW19924.1 hypothetical protein AYR66_10840 [Noviherbaspirillum denitrificans]